MKGKKHSFIVICLCLLMYVFSACSGSGIMEEETVAGDPLEAHDSKTDAPREEEIAGEDISENDPADSGETEYEERTPTTTVYDFEDWDQSKSFTFYCHSDVDSSMTIRNGMLVSTAVYGNGTGQTTNSGFQRKAILKNKYAEVLSASVDFLPADGSTAMYGCLYFNVIGGLESTAYKHTEVGNYYTQINAMAFRMQDKSSQDNKIELTVDYLFEKMVYRYSYTTEPEWNPDSAQALTMTVDKLNVNEYLCTVCLRSDTNKYFQVSIDLADRKSVV